MSFKEWKEVKLGDFVEILSGYAFKSKDFTDDGIPVIKIKNIVPPNVDFSDTQYVSEELYNEKIKYSLNFNDILISLTGSNVNQINSAVGKVGRVKTKKNKLLLNQRVGKVYVKEQSKYSNDFLYYYLIQEHVRYDLASSAGGSANQANINPQNIKDLKINVPPIEEQKAIAKILSDLDNKIEVNNKINKRLEDMAQTIFKHWFVDFEFPNEEGKPYKSSGGEMIESELGMIPKGWEVKELGDIGDLIMGLSPKSKSYNTVGEGTPLLNGAADFNGGLIKPTKYTTQETRLCYKNDLVFCIRATIGNVTFADKEYCLGRGVASIKPKQSVYTGLIYMNLLRSIEQLKSQATGSVILGLSKPDINNINLTLPNNEIIERFADIFSNALDKKHTLELENLKLSNLRDTLLPKLMSGEIRVSID